MKKMLSGLRRIVWSLAILGLLGGGLAGAQEINLDQMVKCGDLICYQALKDPKVFHYLPDQPRLATKNGRPQFSFLKYARAEKTGKAGINRAEGGGIVHFLVTYGADKSRVKQAEKGLQEKYPDAVIDGPIVYRQGSFALITSFKEGDITTTKTVAVGKAPLMEGQKAAVSMALTREGAELLWESFKTDTPDISLVFDMQFTGVREPFEATLEADWARVADHHNVKAGVKYAWFGADVDILFQELRQTGAVKITTKGQNATLENILTSVNNKLLEAMFVPASADELSRAAAEKNSYDSLNLAAKMLKDSAASRTSASSSTTRRTSFMETDPGHAGIDFWAAIMHFLVAEARAEGIGASVGASGAAPSTSTQSETSSAADERYREGVSLYRQGRYQDAIAAFEESDDLFVQQGTHNGNVSYNIGLCHMDLGNYQQAESRFEEAISRYPAGSERAENARAGLEEARRRMSGSSAGTASQSAVGETQAESASDAYNRARRLYEAARTAEFPANATEEALIAYENYQADHSPTGSRAGEVSGRIRMLRERLGASGATSAASSALASQSATSSSSPVAASSTSTTSQPVAAPSASSASQTSMTAAKSPAASTASRRTTTPRRTTTARPGTAASSRSNGSPGFSLVASYKMKKIKRSGKLVYQMNHYRTELQAFAMAENIGSLYKSYGNDPKIFRAVTIDDPVFKQREVLVTLDGQDAASFTRHLNFVTVKLKKQHQSGDVTSDEVVITPEKFNAQGNSFSLGYGYKGDDDRSRWLDYSVETLWSFHGGVDIRIPWQKSDTPMLALQPPYRYRTLTIEGSGNVLTRAGVRHAVVTVTSMINGKPVKNQVTIRNWGPAPALVLDIPEDPANPDVQVAITWHLSGGNSLTAERALEGNIVYWDELPKRGV